jgi:TolB protein
VDTPQTGGGKSRVAVYAIVAGLLFLATVVWVNVARQDEKRIPSSTPSTTSAGAGQDHQQAVIVELDGKIRRQLLGLPSDAFGLSLSPDGSSVAFITATYGSQDQIGVIGIDGHGLRILDAIMPSAEPPAWSPDGSQLAFAGMDENGNVDIHVVNTDGSNLRRLTTNRQVDEFPTWSPDGSTIIYDNVGSEPLDLFGFSKTQELFTVPASGGTRTRLTHNDVSDTGAAFSPDGTQIAWCRDYAIWLADADAGHSRALPLRGMNLMPRWSRNGTKIAYMTYDPSWAAVVTLGTNTASLPVLSIQVVDPKTGDLSDVGGLQVASYWNIPQWLPSGDALLFTRVQRRS